MTNEQQEAFLAGFVKQCEARGVDPEALIKASQAAQAGSKLLAMLGKAKSAIGSAAGKAKEVGKALKPVTPGEGALVGGAAGLVGGAGLQSRYEARKRKYNSPVERIKRLLGL